LLKSMTGFGEGSHHADRGTVLVEVRSVNNRYLKINTKLPDSHSKFEADVERIVRDSVVRGTVSLSIRLPTSGNQHGRINLNVLQSYLDQLSPFASHPTILSSILLLPGVVDDSRAIVDVDLDASLIEKALRDALTNLDSMRLREGAAMKAELLRHCEAIDRLAAEIDERIPIATNAFRDRLVERVRDLLGTQGAAHGLTQQVTVSPADLIREVSIYAERSDVAEELARLRSHVLQFRATMDLPEACGRKLDFLTQEMFRECNTLGSKSADPPISQRAIELKSIVERLREMIANVE
jgi:uncharacterized protein (TIGR00255 family)